MTMVTRIRSMMRKFAKDLSGATAIEYGLIAAGIAVVIIGGVALIGGSLKQTFAAISAALGGG
jgi:pilus assembly protein Flp/PilA